MDIIQRIADIVIWQLERWPFMYGMLIVILVYGIIQIIRGK